MWVKPFESGLACSHLCSAGMVDGQVMKVGESAGKITIKHGPIKKLDMGEGMTMVFRASDPAMLKQVKSGDNIRFDAENVIGQYTVAKSRRRNSGDFVAACRRINERLLNGAFQWGSSCQ